MKKNSREGAKAAKATQKILPQSSQSAQRKRKIKKKGFDFLLGRGFLCLGVMNPGPMVLNLSVLSGFARNKKELSRRRQGRKGNPKNFATELTEDTEVKKKEVKKKDDFDFL